MFSKRRRELLAKTAMDAFKIFLAAVLASDFLTRLPTPLRAIMLVITVGTLVVGFFLMPERCD